MTIKETAGLSRFVESASIDNKLIKRAEVEEMKESVARIPSTRLKESLNDIDCKEGFWVPISKAQDRPEDINLNGRRYTSKLWKNVIDNQRDLWCGAPMLADHPAEGDGSPKDICGVWLDAKLDEKTKLVYGLLIPSGHLGEDLKDHLSKGLRVGTSSSGFGKLLPDGVTVDPDTYTIERLSDWVLNPSQGTYFSYEEDHIENRVRESSEDSTHIKEKSVKDSKITKLEEKKFRRDMESFLESATKIEDPQERLKELNDIKSFLEDGACPDLKEQVEKKILEEETFIKEALKDKIKMKEKFGIENAKDLEKKLTKIVEDTELLNKESKDWKSIAFKVQEKLKKANEELNSRPSNNYVKFQKNRIKEMQNKIVSTEKKAEETINENNKKLEASNNMNGILLEAVKGIKERYLKLKEENKNNKKELKELKAYKEKFEALEESRRESTEKLIKERSELRKQVKSLEEKVNILNEKIRAKNSKISSFNEQIAENKKDLYDLTKKVNAYEKEEEKENEQREYESLSAQEKYYLSLEEQYGRDIRPYRDGIANAITLTEAKKYFITKALPNLSESKEIENNRIPESLYVSPEDRMKFYGEDNFNKSDYLDRMPKGWM